MTSHANLSLHAAQGASGSVARSLAPATDLGGTAYGCMTPCSAARLRERLLIKLFCSKQQSQQPLDATLRCALPRRVQPLSLREVAQAFTLAGAPLSEQGAAVLADAAGSFLPTTSRACVDGAALERFLRTGKGSRAAAAASAQPVASACAAAAAAMRGGDALSPAARRPSKKCKLEATEPSASPTAAPEQLPGDVVMQAVCEHGGCVGPSAACGCAAAAAKQHGVQPGEMVNGPPCGSGSSSSGFGANANAEQTRRTLQEKRTSQGAAHASGAGAERCSQGEAEQLALACAAAKRGDVATLKAAARRGVDLRRAEPAFGRSCLYYACHCGHVRALEYLLLNCYGGAENVPAVELWECRKNALNAAVRSLLEGGGGVPRGAPAAALQVEVGKARGSSSAAEGDDECALGLHDLFGGDDGGS
ncbi:hypothetical protein JKP88DRAFT_266991 [Tribonema minus]|uniref:Uncharacterized protein n=1 Tax=Tribonema minus TaxID=303371 RepID=A0A835ZBW5_9STRA|nr:hypothetical protein JKP88DRAFT_266991 [Tribonema minus]